MQYDNRTQVVYRNQAYPATAIRQGDNVTARVQSNGNNAYYSDYIQINDAADEPLREARAVSSHTLGVTVVLSVI